MNKKISLGVILKDILKSQSYLTTFLYAAIFIVVLVILYLFYDEMFSSSNCNKVYSDIASCSSVLLGFAIAAYAFIINLNGDVLKRLQQKADNGKRPIEVFFAAFTICILFLLLTILLALISLMVNCPFVHSLTLATTALAIFSLFDVTLHLFCLSKIYICN